MKKLNLLFMLMLVSVNTLVADETNPDKELLPEVKNFTVDYAFPNLYFNVTAKNIKTEGVFIIEKFIGDKYIPVAVKEVFAVSASQPILYSVFLHSEDFAGGRFRLVFWGDSEYTVIGEEIIVPSPLAQN
jgi:hypothetical protein